MFRRKTVRLYLRSGQVVKFRTKDWTLKRNSIGVLTEYEVQWSWWHNKRPFSIDLSTVAAVVLSRW